MREITTRKLLVLDGTGEATEVHCQDVTDIAQRIFGDIVIRAQVVLTDDADDVNAVVKDMQHDEQLIDASSAFGMIIVEFVNGKCVQFYVSEWGSIEPFSEPGV